MLEYNMDISKRSYQRSYTADSAGNPFPFRLTEDGYLEAGSRYFTHRDHKRDALFFYTVSGQGIISWKGQTAVLSAGSALLITCDEEHDYRTLSSEPWCFYYAHFVGDGLLGVSMLTERLTPLVPDQPLRMREMFEQIDRLHDRTDRFAFAYRSGLISGLLLHTLRALEVSDVGNRLDVHELFRVREYIRGHLAQSITIDDLAKLYGLSKYHFARLFHRSTGFSPYRYLQIARVDRAKELLVSTDLLLCEIAEEVGLGSSANFGKVFRNIAGMTPSQYRKENYRLNE